MKDKILACSSVLRARIKTLRHELGYKTSDSRELANAALIEDRVDFMDLSVELGNLLIVQPLIVHLAMSGGESMSEEHQRVVNHLLQRYSPSTHLRTGEINQITTNHQEVSEITETNNSTEESNGIVQGIFSLLGFLCAALLACMSSSTTSDSNDYPYNGSKLNPFDPDNMPGKFNDYHE